MNFFIRPRTYVKYARPFFIGEGIMISKIKITKDGRLVGDKWKEEERKYDKGKDITDSFLLYFDRKCTLEEGVTLKSLCLLIRNVNIYSFLSPIFTRSPGWLKEFVVVGLDKSFIEKNLDHVVLK